MTEFPTIDTTRFMMRELNVLDAGLVYKHFSDPVVTQFMDIEPCKDMKEAEEIIQFHMDDSGCRYGLFDKINGQLLGTCGFHCWEKGSIQKAEIGFDLAPGFWGQGFMQEALAEMIRIGFEVMNLDLIEATVEPENIRSQKLLAKMNFVKQQVLVDGLDYYLLEK